MKMKGYSKIKLMNSTNKSKSMDFSDQTLKTPRLQNPISVKKSPTNTLTQDQTKTLYYDDDDYDYNRYSGNNNNQEQQDENFSMENLKINMSGTSHGTTTDAKGTTSRFKIEKQHSTGRTLQTAVKRVISVRRSSSVSERYARIHDQYANYPLDVEEDCQVLQMARSNNIIKKERSGRILKVCKRIFGL